MVCRVSESGVVKMSEFLRPAVQGFAKEMEKRLRANDHKGGWDKCDDGYLVWMLRSNFEELSELIFQESKDVQRITKEAVDIANFAMMIADNAKVKIQTSELEGQPSSSEILRMHMDGTLCQRCGVYLGEAVGRPKMCKGCER